MDEQEKKKRRNKQNQVAISNYVKSHYDDIKIRVQKGDRDLWRDYASAHGFITDGGKASVNAFVIAAVNYAMENDLSSSRDD